jgi:long-subunit acyl-CoA synthetase (AMP-forming)
MTLTLLTSGTTKEPKTVVHSWEYMESCIQRSIKEIRLTQKDTVLDVFPANTIAHYTVTAMPAYRAGAQLISAKFEAIDYLQRFNQCRPTYIALIPRHWELLKERAEWNNMDLSCVRYMVTGSGPVSQAMIDDFVSKGVKTVANWYGMTEMPPPVFVGYNTASFDFKSKDGYSIEFTEEGECVINGFYTGDLFDTKNKVFCNRKTDVSKAKTWKNC